MKVVRPEDITDSRVYFTEFDRTTYSQVAWTEDEVEEIKRSLERKLKLLALVKGHVVVAASHLIESELAHEILLSHPRLFSEGVVVPALRSEFSTVAAFVQAKLDEGREGEFYAGDVRRQMAQMIDSNASLVLPWDVGAASDWFRRRMISDCSAPGSLLRVGVPDGLVRWNDVVANLSDMQRISRNDVYKIGKATGNNGFWDRLCRWTDFNYYLSGAVAVGSEGIIPQETMIDFSLTDLADGRTRLTEMQTFFKIFVDLVKSATQAHFPVDTLDVLTVEDVLALHAAAINDEFIAKYNRIQEQTKEGIEIEDPERLVLLMDEIEQYETDLKSGFDFAIQVELDAYRRQKKTLEVHNIVSTLASLVVPYVDLPGAAKESFVSGLRISGRSDWAAGVNNRIRAGVAALERFVDRRDIDHRPVLLSFVDKIKSRYKDRM